MGRVLRRKALALAKARGSQRGDPRDRQGHQGERMRRRDGKATHVGIPEACARSRAHPRARAGPARRGGAQDPGLVEART